MPGGCGGCGCIGVLDLWGCALGVWAAENLGAPNTAKAKKEGSSFPKEEHPGDTNLRLFCSTAPRSSQSSSVANVHT